MRGLFVVVLALLCSVVDVCGQDIQADRVTARSARVRWLFPSDPALTQTLIQYTNVSTEFTTKNRKEFHTMILAGTVPSGADDHEISLLLPSNSVHTLTTLRNLLPQTAYSVRLAWIDAPGSDPLGSGAAATFTTPAMSNNTDLSTLIVSGGCGQLTSDNKLHYLTTFFDTTTSTTIYQCDVVAESTNVTITIVPQHAYSTITTSTTTLQATNLTLTSTSTSSFVDPLIQYTTIFQLNGVDTVTNYTWTVKSESGVDRNYKLSIRQANQAPTATITGPTSPVVAMVKSPSVATLFQYKGLLWSSATISKWKVWSDDLVTFPFSSLNITINPSLANTATLHVTPATPSVPDGSCSTVYVALFDQNGNSATLSTCISALDDYCSSTPFGSAVTWQSPFTNVAQRTADSLASFYFPPPPTPTFPIA